MHAPDAVVSSVQAEAFVIPTDAPESGGTLAWDSTTLVVAQVKAGARTGLGYTYASAAAAQVIRDSLAPVVLGKPAADVPAAWDAMVAEVRNLGSRGVCACAISAVDSALWDLKARLLDVPLALLLGQRRETVEVYGSGGFTSYEERRLCDQLAQWVQEDGCRWVKMKVGRDPDADLGRVKAVRRVIGGRAGLFVDANGALAAKPALAFAERVASFGVSWFEEPVSSDDLEGLSLLRERAPAVQEPFLTLAADGFETRAAQLAARKDQPGGAGASLIHDAARGAVRRLVAIERRLLRRSKNESRLARARG